MCMNLLLCIIIKVNGAIVVKQSVFLNNRILICSDLCICIYMDMCVYIYIQFLRESVSYASLDFRVINVAASLLLLQHKQTDPLGIFQLNSDLIRV